MIGQTFSFADLVAMFADSGHEPSRYSGRGMGGKECLSLTDDNPINAVLDVIAICASTGDCDRVLALAGLLSHPRSDDLGRSTVVYWPHIRWQDESDDDAS